MRHARATMAEARATMRDAQQMMGKGEAAIELAVALMEAVAKDLDEVRDGVNLEFYVEKGGLKKLFEDWRNDDVTGELKIPIRIAIKILEPEDERGEVQ